MHKVGIISLGCPRNLTDSEVIVGSLKARGFEIRDVEEGVDICIVNTCSFIQSARKESIETILEAVRLKNKKKIKYLIVCGCLGQMGQKELSAELPEIDAIVGTSDFIKIPDLICAIRSGKTKNQVTHNLNYIYDENTPRTLLTPPHYAYIKIAEGCSNRCSYCVIYKLRGDFRSRSIDSVVKEVDMLSSDKKLKEINIIGQDITQFGMDRCGATELPRLLRSLGKEKNSVEWIRLLYTHPAHYNAELIRAVKDEDKVCKYLDIPIQHVSDKILKRMNRKVNKKKIVALINKLREEMPGLVLRTSIIVGFPGETERDFDELLRFVKRIKFNRLGAFVYSREEGTKAAEFRDQVPEKIKNDRYDALMTAQKKISDQLSKKLIGKTLKVLIDEKADGQNGMYIGRTEADAPEIDGVVHVRGSGLKVGEFYRVAIKDAFEYDLVGDAI